MCDYLTCLSLPTMPVHEFILRARDIANKTYDDYQAAKRSGVVSASKLTKMGKLSDKAYRDLETVERLFVAVSEYQS